MADEEKGFASIFKKYVIDDGSTTPASGAQQPPNPPGASPATGPKIIPSWKIPLETIKAAEKLPYKAPGSKPTLTDIEWTEDEYKAHNWANVNTAGEQVSASEYGAEGPASMHLVRGFRLPYCKRLDKNDPKDKQIIEGIKEVRSLMPVPQPPPQYSNHGWLWTKWTGQGAPKVPKICHGYGWSYFPNPGTEYEKYLFGAVMNSLKNALGTPTGFQALAAAKCFVIEGGSPSAINTYDGNVLTMGIGHGQGAHRPWRDARASSAQAEQNIKRAFELCGVSIEYEKLGDAYIAAYQIVDLSDPDNPMVVYCDNYHHGYGWILRKNKWQRIRPRWSVEKLEDLTDGSVEAKAAIEKEFKDAGAKKGITTSYDPKRPGPAEEMNSGGPGPAGYKILKYLTNKDCKDLDVFYSYIAIAEDPLMRDSLFNANWIWKVNGSKAPEPVRAKTECGAVFIGAVSHQCGLSLSRVTPEMVLSKEDIGFLDTLRKRNGKPDGGQVRTNNGVLTADMLKSPASEDEARAMHDALLCKAIVRSSACMWEFDRIAQAVRLFLAEKKKNADAKPKIDLYADNIFSYVKMWRMEEARNRWLEMMSGKIVTDTLDTLKQRAGFEPAEVTSFRKSLVKIPWGRFEGSNGKANFDIKTAWPDQKAFEGIGEGKWRAADLYGFPVGRSVSSFKFLIAPKDDLKKLPQITRDLSWAFSLVGVELKGEVPARLTFSGGMDDPKTYDIDSGVLDRFQQKQGS